MSDLHRSLLGDLAASGRWAARVGGIRPLHEGGKVLTVPDAPTRSLVVDCRGEPLAVLFVSQPVDPGYVARNLQNAAGARRLLGEDLGSVILEPICAGEHRGLTFALWPWHRSMTSVRGLAYLQRRLMLPRMLSWLLEATRSTARRPSGEELASLFAEPLARMARDPRMPAPAGDLARRGLERLHTGAWAPRVVLQHKDFGHWNVLVPRDRSQRRRFPRGFILIDWAGARLRGYPFVNLLMLGRTSRLGRALVRRELLRHCRVLSCERRDIVPYVLAALGHIGLHLGHFAEADYLALCRTMVGYSCELA